MKKNRLITFGCSYTYGQGLPDCENIPIINLHRLKPSQMGWPTLVSNYLDLDLVNMSHPGSSNFEILYSILEFNFQPNDTVVIMWSHYLRDLFFTRWFKSLIFRRRLGLWKKTTIARRWIDQMSERDYAMKTWIYMHHAGLHLENLNLKYIHYPAAPDELEAYPSIVELKNLYTHGIIFVDKSLDNIHPGIQSQKIMADEIYKILNED